MPTSKMRPLQDDLRHMSLPGSAAFRLDQAEQDCRDLETISDLLRKTAGAITPIIQRLTYGTLPLAVRESCIMLEALAEEIERDDVATVQEAAAL